MSQEASLAVDHIPLPPPAPPKDASPPADTLTKAQKDMYKAVLEHFQNPEYKLSGVEKGELMDEEKFWLSSECMLRYLRAVKWHSAKAAIQRIEETLRWRREYGLYETSPDDVKIESLTGKEIIFGFDVQRRPALYMIPSRQNTEESPRQILYAIWMLERTLDLAGPGVETLVLMINFSDRGKSPSFATSRTVLNILQSHYPERLGTAMILNVPFILNAFFKLITPFVDPHTRTKMKFNPKPVEDELFTADQLFKDGGWNGGRNFQWDHDKYWPHLIQMCAEIRERQMAEWRKLGARPGLSEWDIKMASLQEPLTVEPTPAVAADVVAPAEDATAAAV